jgi:hypothetical protein
MLSIIITLAVIGVVLWLINTYLPIAAPIKKVINIVALICVVLWLLNCFHVLDRLDTVGVPNLGGHSHERYEERR